MAVTNAVAAAAAPSYNVGTSSDAIKAISDIATANTAASAKEAENLRNWQVQQNKIAMDYNMAEAAKNREWQEYMSNTAHQREVADLKAAGLNPVLSAMGGNGASVGSGATASAVTSAGAKGDVDTSATGAVMNLLTTMLAAETNLAQTSMSAVSNLAAANMAANASQYAASMSYQSTKYNSDTQKYLTENYPSNAWQAVAQVLGGSSNATNAVKNSWHNPVNAGAVRSQSNKVNSAFSSFASNVGSFFKKLVSPYYGK